MTYQRGNYTLVSDEEIPGMPQIRWDPHMAVVALPLYQPGLTCLATVVLDQRTLAQHFAHYRRRHLLLVHRRILATVCLPGHLRGLQ